MVFVLPSDTSRKGLAGALAISRTCSDSAACVHWERCLGGSWPGRCSVLLSGSFPWSDLCFDVAWQVSERVHIGCACGVKARGEAGRSARWLIAGVMCPRCSKRLTVVTYRRNHGPRFQPRELVMSHLREEACFAAQIEAFDTGQLALGRPGLPVPQCASIGAYFAARLPTTTPGSLSRCSNWWELQWPEGRGSSDPPILSQAKYVAGLGGCMLRAEPAELKEQLRPPAAVPSLGRQQSCPTEV